MPKLLIIEDDTRLADIIRRGLEEEGFDVQVAYDGSVGLGLALEGDYDLVVSDIVLPGVGGLDLCRKIRDAKPLLPVLMLTALGTTDDKVGGFDAGADDYLTKPFEIREMIARIKALLKRAGNHNMQASPLLRYADLEINVHKKTATRGNQEIQLTPREFSLLEYMVRNPERVLTRTEIAEKVWNTYFDTGTNFIDVYITYLRKKVDKPFKKKLIHTRPGMGFILME